MKTLEDAFLKTPNIPPLFSHWFKRNVWVVIVEIMLREGLNLAIIQRSKHMLSMGNYIVL
jgi:hypothetical protein